MEHWNTGTLVQVWEQGFGHSELDVDFLEGRSCADVNGCIGVHAQSGKCVCYHGGQLDSVAQRSHTNDVEE